MEFSAKIKISDDLFRLASRGERGVNAGLIRVAGAVEAAAVKEAPVRSGNLAGGIRKSEPHNQTIIVSSVAKNRESKNYAPWVHGGTGIYGPLKMRIVPRSKKALAFQAGGRKLVRKSVRGQKANPYMQRARDEVDPKAREIFMEGFEFGMRGKG